MYLPVFRETVGFVHGCVLPAHRGNDIRLLGPTRLAGAMKRTNSGQSKAASGWATSLRHKTRSASSHGWALADSAHREQSGSTSRSPHLAWHAQTWRAGALQRPRCVLSPPPQSAGAVPPARGRNPDPNSSPPHRRSDSPASSAGQLYARHGSTPTAAPQPPPGGVGDTPRAPGVGM